MFKDIGNRWTLSATWNSFKTFGLGFECYVESDYYWNSWLEDGDGIKESKVARIFRIDLLFFSVSVCYWFKSIKD